MAGRLFVGFGVWLAACAVTGCETAPHGSSQPVTPVPADAVATARGQYLVTCHTSPDPVPVNELFQMTVQVFDARGQPVSGQDVHLLVDADMPEHRHGMNTRPEVTWRDGGFRVDGMLFHMPGHWEIYLDVVRGGAVERATVIVEL